MNKSATSIVKLADYKKYPFRIDNVFIKFYIFDEYIFVSSLMNITPINSEINQLVLDGVDIELEAISINGEIINESEYELSARKLAINIPLEVNQSFELKIKNKIYHCNNTSLEGAYLSDGILATQCEAEGFRRICFYPDRPDVLSKFKVMIEADISKFPTLLSNGNRIYSALVENDSSRHYVIWEDPHPKPSYLFALVAGSLEYVEDNYLTRKGRNVNIRLYVDCGEKKFTNHAINSLKKAMDWDEDVYGLEYDLDEYNIVAIRHFNMGAMENKGLNIFNSKLILADKKISTDEELQRIEGVIAHEYFHNWTGNRITCRDWFQLSLKEGLTVFRDQSFTADLHSKSLKRIEDISFLRNTQFSEDAGPTSHAVKPIEYSAIDNFYTTTIYEKGAELIRMLQIIIGNEKFMLGMNLYLQRFDGSSATTDDFLDAIEEGSGINDDFQRIDMNKFRFWYYKKGTPSVKIDRRWNSENGELTIVVNQSFLNFDSSVKDESFIIPIKFAVISSQGETLQEQILINDKYKQEFKIRNLPRETSIPITSFFRGFSAPVNWESDLSDGDYFHLLRCDDDPFSRWEAGQYLMRKILIQRSIGSPNFEIENCLINTFNELLNNMNINKGLLAELLSLPRLNELENYQDSIDPISLYEARESLIYILSDNLKNPLEKLLNKIKEEIFQSWPNGQNSRKLTKIIWFYLVLIRDATFIKEILSMVSSDSMTIAKAALDALKNVDCEEREIAYEVFYERWNHIPFILDTWFHLQSSTPRDNALEVTNSLLDHHLFDRKAPNAIRAVLGGFASNTTAFHAKDGSGYEFVITQIRELDSINPITASRLVKLFSNYRKYVPVNKMKIEENLISLSESKLSTNTREIVSMILPKPD